MINRVWLRRFFDNAALLVSVPALFSLAGYWGLFSEEPWALSAMAPLTLLFAALMLTIVQITTVRMNLNLAVGFGVTRRQACWGTLLAQYGLMTVCVLAALGEGVLLSKGQNLSAIGPLAALLVLMGNLGMMAGLAQDSGKMGQVFAFCVMILASAMIGGLCSLQITMGAQVLDTIASFLDHPALYAAALTAGAAGVPLLMRYAARMRVSF